MDGGLVSSVHDGYPAPTPSEPTEFLYSWLYYAIYHNSRTGFTDCILYFDKMKPFFKFLIFLILELSWHTLKGIKRRNNLENVGSYRVLPKSSSLLVLRSLYKPLLLKH